LDCHRPWHKPHARGSRDRQPPNGCAGYSSAGGMLPWWFPPATRNLRSSPEDVARRGELWWVARSDPGRASAPRSPQIEPLPGLPEFQQPADIAGLAPWLDSVEQWPRGRAEPENQEALVARA